MKQLAWKLALPLTIISFTLWTKWWYVLPVDAPDTMMLGFPLPYVGDGWHTSLSLQIFVLELLFDLLCYFLFWYSIIFIIKKFSGKIKVGKALTISLLSISLICTALLVFIATYTGYNLVYLKRPFNAETLTTGYKFIWEGNPRPQNFDFKKLEREKALLINNRSAPPLCGTYMNKSNGELFQLRARLRLNCDSTFGYNRSSCLGDDTSFGQWKNIGGKIYLYSTKELLNTIKSQEVFDRTTFVDLNNAIVNQIKDGIVLSNAHNFSDTLLSKQEWEKPKSEWKIYVPNFRE